MKSDANTAFILDAISDNTLFKNLDIELQKRLVGCFYPTTCKKGDVIIKQDEKGDVLYVLESGGVAISVTTSAGAEARVGVLEKPGTVFGDLALLYGTPRAATCVCETETELWCISRQTCSSRARVHAPLVRPDSRCTQTAAPSVTSRRCKPRSTLICYHRK